MGEKRGYTISIGTKIMAAITPDKDERTLPGQPVGTCWLQMSGIGDENDAKAGLAECQEILLSMLSNHALGIEMYEYAASWA
jgi:hypothetical protein